jgi:hypothetical protein
LCSKLDRGTKCRLCSGPGSGKHSFSCLISFVSNYYSGSTHKFSSTRRLHSLFVAPAHHPLQQHASHEITASHPSDSSPLLIYSTHPFICRIVPSLSLELLWSTRPSWLILVPFCIDSKQCSRSKHPAGFFPYRPMRSSFHLSHKSDSIS